jgi:methyl-accepting chemotaxis protein
MKSTFANFSDVVSDLVNKKYAVIEFDPNGIILNANKNFLSTVGYTLGEIKGKHHKIFCSNELVNSVDYKIFWENLSSGEAISGDFERVTKSGHKIIIQGTYEPVKNDDGSVKGVVKVVSDITELKQLANMKQMVDLSPINTMFADPSGTLVYMNENSRKTLKTLEKYLPDRVENLIGRSIDMFHAKPEHQRRLIADPRNLPITTKIKVGPETLDLLVTAITDSNGKYLGPMVTWEVITKQEETKKTMATMKQMVDLSPINTMFFLIKMAI